MTAGLCVFSGFWDGGPTTAPYGSEPWPMGGRWGVEVAWSVGLGECCGLGVAQSRIGGSLVGGDEVCVSVLAVTAAVISSTSV